MMHREPLAAPSPALHPDATLDALLRRPIYDAYLYSYPHKTAYRPMEPPVPLRELWRDERREALSLYIHVPFCEARCGYCNLFSRARPPAVETQAYLATLERQAAAVHEAIAPARFSRFAIGGGTPTVLDAAGLETLLDLAGRLGAEIHATPTSVEVSPATVTEEKLALLRERGVDRVSIGVQSFVDSELRALHRRQAAAEVSGALRAIRDLRFPTLNIDLIYGIEGQTVPSWEESVRAALEWSPEELYLYPLYVRPLTPLGQAHRAWDDDRLHMYRAARELLLSAGYRQISMRMFRSRSAPEAGGPVFRCQEDGMVGLGCGARSYTAHLHYSLEYAVRALDVRAILRAYGSRSDDELRRADWGIRIDDEDRRRRHVILSLLSSEGLDLGYYRRRFGSDAHADLAQLEELRRGGLAALEGDRLSLTPAGLERSDAIGPWLRSPRVAQLMAGYRPR
jgi:oxygen-independent coproporphyrinogen-3 oxidase